MDDVDHDHRKQFELHVGGKQVSSILTAGSLTSRIQFRGSSQFYHAGVKGSVSSGHDKLCIIGARVRTSSALGFTISFGTLLA